MEKELIIHLIAQDIKHNILILGIESLRLSGTEHHDLDLISAVSTLMEIEEGSVSDEWSMTYNNYMLRASELKPDFKVEGLKELATECYNSLEKVLASQA